MSFADILQSDTDKDEDKNHNQPQIISHSSYYEFYKLISILTNRKQLFSIFSTNLVNKSKMCDVLKMFVEHLKTVNCEFSTFLFTGMYILWWWPTELKGYTFILQGRSCSTKGI